MWLRIYIFFFILCLILGVPFHLDWNKGVFLLDNHTFSFVAGCIHYFRVPRPYWRHSLQLMRAAGLNVLQTSAEWSTHEPSPNEFDFEGQNDLVHFLQIAHEEGLYVILGIGPFIGAERDFGGLPPWILWKCPTIQLRSNDPNYLYRVDIYLSQLLTRIWPLLIQNNGSIIMLQLTSESPEHTKVLLELCRMYIGPDVEVRVLHTNKQQVLPLDPEIIHVLENDWTSDTRSLHFSPRKMSPLGPEINMEVEIGWPAIWEHPWKQLSPVGFSKILDYILPDTATNLTSCSLAMFHGGTNFGFSAGARYLPTTGRYAPYATSYDGGAPLDEAGVPTNNYILLKNAVTRYLVAPQEVPNITHSSAWYGVFPLYGTACLLENHALAARIKKCRHPLTFEQLKQSSGLVIYEKLLEKNLGDVVLYASKLRDRAQVYVDRMLMGIISWSENRLLLKDMRKGSLLQIVVENQGRVYPNSNKYSFYYKGLSNGIEPVYLGELELYNWTMYSFPLDDSLLVHKFAESLPGRQFRWHFCTPTLYKTEFQLPSTTRDPADTYIDMKGWGKGIVWVNGNNLGRYWPSAGPQETLYLPGCYLKPSPKVNKMVVLELEKPNPALTVTLKDKPVIRLASSNSLNAVAAFCLMCAVLIAMLFASRNYAQWNVF